MTVYELYEVRSTLTSKPVGKFYLRVEGDKTNLFLSGTAIEINRMSITPEERSTIEEFYQLSEQETSVRDKISQLVKKLE